MYQLDFFIPNVADTHSITEIKVISVLKVWVNSFGHFWQFLSDNKNKKLWIFYALFLVLPSKFWTLNKNHTNIETLEIKTFGLGSRIRDVEVSGLKIHNFLPWGHSSNLIGSAKVFLRLLRNFYLILLSVNQLLHAIFGLQ